MDNNTTRFYIRRRFSLALQPIKILFHSKKDLLSKDDWFLFVQQTKERILQNPQEYLGTDLPAKEIIHDSIEFIFRDFLLRNYKSVRTVETRMKIFVLQSEKRKLFE